MTIDRVPIIWRIPSTADGVCDLTPSKLEVLFGESSCYIDMKTTDETVKKLQEQLGHPVAQSSLDDEITRSLWIDDDSANNSGRVDFSLPDLIVTGSHEGNHLLAGILKEERFNQVLVFVWASPAPEFAALNTLQGRVFWKPQFGGNPQQIVAVILDLLEVIFEAKAPPDSNGHADEDAGLRDENDPDSSVHDAQESAYFEEEPAIV